MQNYYSNSVFVMIDNDTKVTRSNIVINVIGKIVDCVPWVA